MQSLVAAHPVLRQEQAPWGEHYQVSDSRFPRVDEEGNCWAPADWDGSDAATWEDYDDPRSELLRDECALQPWLDVCFRPLTWASVDCDGNGEVALKKKKKKEPKGALFWILALVAAPFQLAGVAWELLGVFTMWLPGYLVLLPFAALDTVLDWVFLITFGLFCKPCAALFIWIINLAMLPLMFLGMLQRLWIQTFGMVVDGWLILLGGSGCVYRFGKHCWLGGRFRQRPLRHKLDIPWFTSLITPEPVGQTFLKMVTPPKIEKQSDILRAGHAGRTALWHLLPGGHAWHSAVEAVLDHIDF